MIRRSTRSSTPRRRSPVSLAGARLVRTAVLASVAASSAPALAAAAPLAATPRLPALPPAPPALPAAAQLAVDLAAKDAPLRLGFEVVRRVGAPGALFTDITAGRFGDDSTLYVIDQGLDLANRLVAVRADGSVQEIGRRGQGPGEFSGLSHVAPLPGGRVAAFDFFHGAYQIFGPDGSFERMVKLGSGAGASGAAMMGAMGMNARPAWKGDDLLSLREVVMDVSAIDEGELRMSPGAALERIGLGGDSATADTVLVAWSPPPGDGSQLEMRGLRVEATRMFAPRVLYDVAYDGAFVFSDSTEYAIKVADAGGDVERVLRRPFRAVPVGRRIRERAKDAMREQLDEAMETTGFQGAAEPVRRMMEEQIGALAFYEEISVVKDVRAGWENSIWVQRTSEDAPWDETAPGPVDVLLRDGRYAGTFPAAAEALPLALGPNGLAAYVETDALDQPALVIRRLPPELR